MAQRFRIIAIAQVHNEIRRGNLERFFLHLKPIVDDIVIYDDASTDGSYEYALSQTQHVLRGFSNNFFNERQHRQELLTKALSLKADFVLWLDADEVVTHGAAQAWDELCQKMIDRGLDGLSFHEINLWRSTAWRRTDNKYDDGWYVRLWRVTPSLAFSHVNPGLHQQLYPDSIKRIEKTDQLAIIHYGFASDEAIAYKYLNYKQHGQRGWKLHRFIDESALTLEAVPINLFPPQLRAPAAKPVPRSIIEWHQYLDKHRGELLRPSVSIVAMIYKSTSWLQFCYEQVLRYTDMRDKEFFFVANDPTDEVLSYLERHYIPHKVFRTTSAQKEEWYINNVYRGYNFGADQARGDYLLFINSDMAFTPNWVEHLVAGIEDKSCIASRLVESGKLPSGAHAIPKNFGQELATYNEQAFQKYAKQIQRPGYINGGLYMPLLIKRQDFLDIGGYPEGNVAVGSDPFHPMIAKQGDPLISGDTTMIQKAAARGIRHRTSNSSIVYHFQEGEKDDSSNADHSQEIKVVIVNDYLTGRNGEKTMWDFLLERLPGVIGVDMTVIGKGENFSQRARLYITKHFPNTRVIIQNATFIDIIDPTIFTIAILQDDLRRMKTPSPQQEKNLTQADVLVTNSIQTASSYPEYTFELISLGVDDELFHPQDKAAARLEFHLPTGKIGIFVGSLSETKGWPEVKQIIANRPDIHWIVVTKYNEDYAAPNVTLFKQIDQKKLVRLLNAADFFLLGSPVETQCLAAIEASLCDIPVIMHRTGIFADFSEADRSQIGYFSESLSDKIDLLDTQKDTLSPRKTILRQSLTISAMTQKWHTLLMQVIQQIDQEISIKKTTPLAQRVNAFLNTLYHQYRLSLMNIIKKLLRPILPKSLADKLYRIVYR